MQNAHREFRVFVVFFLIAMAAVIASCRESDSNSTTDSNTSSHGDTATESDTTNHGTDSQTQSDTSSDTSTDGNTTVESFCRAFSQRICDGLVACGCRFDQRAYDAEHCVDARTADCTSNFSAKIGPDIAAGRARLDEGSSEACLEATSDLSQRCVLGTGIGEPLPDACNSLVVSTALVGEACELRGEGLAFCGTGGQGVCLPGDTGVTCTSLPGEGTPCPLDLCAPGLICNGSICAKRGDLDAPCESPNACQDGLVCGPTKHCVAPLASGDNCEFSTQCQQGLACDQNECKALANLGDDCSSPQACGAERSCGRAPETRVCTDPDTEGEACEFATCSVDLACASSADSTCTPLPGVDEPCLDGAYCAPGLTCLFGLDTCGTLAGPGEPCTVGVRFCADGLGCRPSDNTCQEGPGVGEPCYDNPPDPLCGQGLGCDFGPQSLCIPISGEGSPCNSDRTCTADTYCDWSIMQCAARLVEGAPCKYGNECLAGHECRSQAGAVTCLPLPTREEPCVYDCASGLVCKGAGGQCVPEFCVIP
ncbi:MAG: hypothetical protein MUC50_22795 [Myxococcota bacterium]|jgi:hypothetical protein|nr:hypothetical protein [Myxococcota bacterium]